MEEFEATLGEIMDYCKEHEIEINTTQERPATINGNWQYGDVYSQEYFFYYTAHKNEIDTWIKEQRENLSQSHTGMHR